MANMSDYLETQLINHVFRTSSYTKPSTLAIALCTSAPTDSDTGSLTGKEVSNAGSYARVALNPLDANWAATSGGNGTTSNVSTITFPTATADWGTVTHVAICDSSTYGGGNLLFWGPLTASKTVSNGDTLTLSASGLSVQLDN